jgi:transcriptional regulator GlxA family with amidase domain
MRTIALAAVTAASLAVAPPAGSAPAEPAAAAKLVLPAAKPGHRRPLAVVVATRAGAEVTDFIVPYGVLKESGLFDVRTVSTDGGVIPLFHSIKVRADQTPAQFDASIPDGADIVIVPAQLAPKDKRLIAWIRAQAARGATIVSICEGARVLANAGLLERKHAATHWAAYKGLEHAFPNTTWVRDRRYVQDGRIISTAGVSASIPVSIALVEAEGGHAAAQKVAAEVGAQDWGVRHHTADFELSTGDFVHAAGDYLAAWTHETVEVPVANGVDEVALALRVDAWTRSYRTRIILTNPAAAVRSRHGLTIMADGRPRAGHRVEAPPGPALAQLDATLREMGRRYGPFSVRLATATMEYDGPAQPPGASPPREVARR